MDHPQLQRVELLISQGRLVEAEKQLRNYLEEYPIDAYGRYLLGYVLFFKGKSKDAEEIILALQMEDPDNPSYLALLTEIDLKEEEYESAEKKSDILLQMAPEEADFHTLKSRIKFSQRYYDSALKFANSALALDPNNLKALNLKTMLAVILGDKDSARNTIQEALEQNPEDPYTIANHANQLLLEGKERESLERFAEALRINPTNTLARYGMRDALKSKFLIYRIFYHYFNMMMGRLTAKGSWTFIIGTYIAYRIISKLSESMPVLKPLVYVILGCFILTWIINPLMNLYLMTNNYGRLLLDDDDKKMAVFTGVSLVLAIGSFLVFYVTSGEIWVTAGIFFVAMMIPLGTFLSPYKEGDKKKLTYYTVALAVTGICGILLVQQSLIMIAFLGIFIYQFVVNSIVISNISRRIE